MNGFGPTMFGNVQDLVNPQVGVRGGRRSDGIGFVGFADVKRGSIDVGVNGYGGDPHLVARANDADRYCSSIGDKNLLEHFVSSKLVRDVPPRFYMRDGRACREELIA